METVDYKQVPSILPRIEAGEVTEVQYTLIKAIAGESGDEITSLTVSEPTCREIELMDSVKGEVAKVRYLLAALNKIPPPLLLNLSGRDMTMLGGLVGSFLGFAPPTGGT